MPAHLELKNTRYRIQNAASDTMIPSTKSVVNPSTDDCAATGAGNPTNRTTAAVKSCALSDDIDAKKAIFRHKSKINQCRRFLLPLQRLMRRRHLHTRPRRLSRCNAFVFVARAMGVARARVK